jgi:hypothetical protein
MKLLAASTLALASTYSAQQSIESLIGELVDKVYQHDPIAKTYTFNLAPYFEATYTCQGNGFTSEGSLGNGNGVFEFVETASWSDVGIEYEWEIEGKTKSHPLVDVLSVPAGLLEDTVSSDGSLSLTTEGIKWKVVGNINGVQTTQSIALTLDSMTMTRSKYETQISFNRNSVIPSSINPFYTQFLMPEGSTNVGLKLSAKKICGENPLDKSCTGKIVVTGDNDGLDFGNNVAKYSVQNKKAQFEVKHNNNQVFWMGLFGIDSFEVLSLKYRVNGGKAVLAVQFAGPNGFQPVVIAAESFAGPYIGFFSNINTFDQTAHIVAYFDKVAATFDNALFNVYPIVQATQFESDLLADVLGMSFQKWAKNMANVAADGIVSFSQSAGEMVSDSRTYINNLTGPVGEQKFDTWFANLA